MGYTQSKICSYDYSITLMWINRELKTEQTLVYNGDSQCFLNPIKEWSKLNPNIFIHVWYD